MGKILLITGGTGSFGEAVLKKFIAKKKYSEIRIFSRDEKKQFDMRKKFSMKNIKFFLGDIRDQDSISKALANVDHVFHAAALKQVPSCEFYPDEAIKTNVLGTKNLIEMSKKHKVKKVIFLSTDKAVYPVNAMGLTKALMEKLVVANHLTKNDSTIFCVVRYGNVMGSRGSVIPTFVSQIKDRKPITITDNKMTRFMMTMDEAIELVIYALDKGKNGEILVKKTESATIERLVNVMKNYFNNIKTKTKYIGIRHGEKLHETLLSSEEMSIAIEKKNFFIIPPDNRDINYDKFFNLGNKKVNVVDYNSRNAKQLTNNELLNKLKKIL